MLPRLDDCSDAGLPLFDIPMGGELDVAVFNRMWDVRTMSGAHNLYLVTLSILVAVFASYTALSLAYRMRASQGWTRRIWLAAAATALGGGIWSMHFIAMLAFSMPGMEIGYDLTQTLLSLGIALLFTGAGLALSDWREIVPSRLAAAGILIGSGVVAMHYIGMAAMRMAATPSYEWPWLLASAVIAVVAATTAVYLAARDRKFAHRVVAAGVMGIAIAGMHFAGMRAVTFNMSHASESAASAANLGQTFLAVLIGGVTIVVLVIALGGAALERLFHGFALREARTALRLRIADSLRSDSPEHGLHETAALLGAHFGVSRTGYGQLDPVDDIFDFDVCWTDGSVPELRGRLPAAAFGVKIVASLKEGRTVAIGDLLHADMSDEAITRETARSVDTRAILVVPFLRGGRLRTIVYLNSRSPRVWRPEDIGFIEEIAERTRLVIERAAAEDELRAMNATLEERVDARTRELREAQEALLHVQKLEAVGQLVSGMAHDFNNVLAAIAGSFDLVRRRSNDPERVRAYAEAGLDATKRGAKLTAQLLVFARSQRIELRPLFLSDLIYPLRDLLAPTLGPMIKLDFDLSPEPVAVLADPTQVEMMVVNLAINARDAMPTGGALTISTRIRAVAGDHELPDGEYVELAVRDTGIGMDEGTLRRAIEPFFTTKPVGKGTGLGLAQIHGSARQAGGTVRLESSVGQGTTVRVLLPRTDQLPASASPRTSHDNTLRRVPLDILLVDDDQSVRSIVANGLEDLGHRVMQAGGGDEALKQLEAASFHVAVIDYAMPGMNGAELAAEVTKRRPDLPIIFASGFADTADIEAALGRRVVILRKPFTADELQLALTDVVKSDNTALAASVS